MRKGRQAWIHLEPGERTTVALVVQAEDLAFYDVDAGAFAVEPGPQEIMIGSSSENIRVTTELAVTAAGRWDP